MRILGISALAAAVASFFLWFANWILYNFIFVAIPFTSPLRYVTLTISFLSFLTLYAAVILLGIGLIIGAKQTGFGVNRPD